MYSAVGAYTNAPPLVVRANAYRPVPGVKLPVAAPSWTLDFTSVASCWRLRPLAAGNCEAFGCRAAGSSSTAGGSTPVAWLVDVLGVLEVVSGPVGLDDEPLLLDEPQPASAI